MSDSSPNVMLSYMYRDAGNYKQYGEVVFANPDRLPISTAEETIGRVLIDGQFFVPTEWSVPFIYGFIYDPDFDHSWHEVCELSTTEALPTDVRTLKQFLIELAGTSRASVPESARDSSPKQAPANPPPFDPMWGNESA